MEAAFASTHTTEHRTVKTGQITYHWNWGDGGTNASIGASSSSHTFLAPGNYTVRLTANNNFSRATVSTVVNVLGTGARQGGGGGGKGGRGGMRGERRGREEYGGAGEMPKNMPQ